MLYLTCTTITSVDLAHYGVSCAKDWVSVDCGTNRLTYRLKSPLIQNNQPVCALDNYQGYTPQIASKFPMEDHEMHD